MPLCVPVASFPGSTSQLLFARWEVKPGNEADVPAPLSQDLTGSSKHFTRMAHQLQLIPISIMQIGSNILLVSLS